MIVNRSALQDLFIAFRNSFQQGYRSFAEQQMMWNLIATEVPSTTQENHYAWLGQFPRLRKWVGDRHIEQMASHDYRIKNEKFEATVGVSRDEVEDDQYGVYRPMMEEMGWGAASHPEELIFGLLAAGFTSLCYDGQPMFDADHPVGRNTTTSVSNFQSGSSTPWFLIDARRPLKPLIFQKRRDYDFRSLNDLEDDHVFKRDEFLYGVDARVNVGFGFWQQSYGSKADLTAANFNDAMSAIMSVESDEGRPLGIMPSHLVVPPTLRDEALEIVKAERNAAGATNINRNAVEILVTPWLNV